MSLSAIDVLKAEQALVYVYGLLDPGGLVVVFIGDHLHLVWHREELKGIALTWTEVLGRTYELLKFHEHNVCWKTSGFIPDLPVYLTGSVQTVHCDPS